MKKLLALLKAKGATAEEIKEIEDELEADAAAAVETEVAGLKKKNAELITKNKALSGEEGSKVAELETELQELRESIAKAQKEHEKQIKTLETAKAQLEQDLTGKLSSEQSAVTRLVLEEGLTKGITGLGITKPAQIAAVRALLKEKGILSVKSEGDIRKAIAKIQKDGKESELELDAYLKEWAGSDEGKEFIPAAQNQGGGAQGGAGRGAQQQEGGPKLGKNVLDSLRIAREGAGAEA